MADEPAETARPARKSGPSADPVQALVSALFDDGVPEQARKQARTEFSAIADAGRPWEQLPSGLKTAARADAVRIAGGSGKAPELVDAGYSARIAAQLLRDIGRV